MAASTVVRPARVDEYIQAFRLIFSTLTSELRDQRCLIALYLISRGDLDPAGLLVIAGTDGLEGAMLAQRLPGAAGVVWPPGVQPGERSTHHEDLLCQEALAWLRQGGAALVQALLSDDEVAHEAPLLRNRFNRITDLWMLRHDFAQLPPVVAVACRSWDEVDHDLFGDTLLRTYEGSQDCPELTGTRSAGEILAGHRNTGIFDPTRWWLILDGERPVGVLLLSELPDEKNWDVSYVGVVPEARRHGLGRRLMVKALAAAQEAGAPALTLAVDGRNVPALELYRSLGFQPQERRVVYLVLRP